MSEPDENKIKWLVQKVVLIGESGVGKTSIIKQFTFHSFDPDCNASISSQFSTKKIMIKDIKKTIQFDLWDTAGQEKYRSLAKIFYKDADVIIFVYEIRNKKSFESLKDYWYKEVTSNCKSNAFFVIIGNKNDLYDSSEVDEIEAMNWADSIGAIFQTTSAKTNTGIDLLFENIGKKCFDPKFNYRSEEDRKKKMYEIKKGNKNEEKDDDDNEQNKEDIPDVQKIQLNDNKVNNKKNRCC